jgi:hypothetical protein
MYILKVVFKNTLLDELVAQFPSQADATDTVILVVKCISKNLCPFFRTKCNE